MSSILGLIVALSLISCTPRRSLDGGDIERRQYRGEPAQGAQLAPLMIFRGKYKFTIQQVRRGRNVCNGDAQIEQFEFHTQTTGTAQCDALLFRVAGSKEIKIVDPSEGHAKPVDSLPHQDNRITRISELGRMRFEPSFPTFLGPVFQNIEKFKDVDEVQAFDLILPPSEKFPAGERHSGKIHVKTLEIHGCADYPPRFFADHKDVIRFQMNIVEGFENLKAKSTYGLYDRYELCVKTNPLAVVHVNIQSKASDFETDSLAGKLGDIFTQGIIADLDLLHHESF